MTWPVAVRPVGPAEIDALSELFASARTTRHCWCMSFCTTRAAFVAGWFGGGNRRRFEAMSQSDGPMGVLAFHDDVPVGWGACGPRTRYLGPDPSRHPLLGDRPRSEDEQVWLMPCLFVRVGRRGQGVSHALVEAVVAVAREHRAAAVEAWPTSRAGRSADAFLGREGLFAELGFRCVARPLPHRTLMRLDLLGGSGSAAARPSPAPLW